MKLLSGILRVENLGLLAILKQKLILIEDILLLLQELPGLELHVELLLVLVLLQLLVEVKLLLVIIVVKLILNLRHQILYFLVLIAVFVLSLRHFLLVLHRYAIFIGAREVFVVDFLVVEL